MNELLNLATLVESKHGPVQQIAIARLARSGRRHPLVAQPKELQGSVGAGYANHVAALRAGDVVVGTWGLNPPELEPTSDCKVNGPSG